MLACTTNNLTHPKKNAARAMLQLVGIRRNAVEPQNRDETGKPCIVSREDSHPSTYAY
ncbi:hypothetical protein MBLL_03607 [Methylobacterium bullatum]|jgi:hypothetical protein|uniref:Uncharacterized protein n=1 Tax=Methylobacterium bullatum TaxID=570505 RepID=A0A679JV87_9HYPH|nr:hypothetical protein MBLL_03607 [Methylobacterium bullatum]